jgi:hypothetical protein
MSLAEFVVQPEQCPCIESIPGVLRKRLPIFANYSSAFDLLHATGTSACALPASEWLFLPDLAFRGPKEFVPVLISRSGHLRGCAPPPNTSSKLWAPFRLRCPEQMNGAP